MAQCTSIISSESTYQSDFRVFACLIAVAISSPSNATSPTPVTLLDVHLSQVLTKFTRKHQKAAKFNHDKGIYYVIHTPARLIPQLPMSASTGQYLRLFYSSKPSSSSSSATLWEENTFFASFYSDANLMNYIFIYKYKDQQGQFITFHNPTLANFPLNTSQMLNAHTFPHQIIPGVFVWVVKP